MTTETTAGDETPMSMDTDPPAETPRRSESSSYSDMSAVERRVDDIAAESMAAAGMAGAGAADLSMAAAGAADLSTAEKGTFGPRLVAYIIDSIILFVVNFVLGFALRLLPGSGGGATMLSWALSLLVPLAYFVYFWSTTGATPGKKAMNLRVVAVDGSPITGGKAFVRYIGYIISAIVFFLGFIWIAIDQDRQGWHDKIAGTYVVKV